MLDPAQQIALLDRVVEDFIGHARFSRHEGSRRLANRLVRFVAAEVERICGNGLPPSRPLPNTDGWLEFVQDVVDGGMPTYDAQDERIATLMEELTQMLGPEGHALLNELEAAFNERNNRWAEDRFGLGVLLGQTSLSGLMNEGPLGRTISESAPLSTLGLGVRTLGALGRAGITTVGQLRALSWTNVGDIQGIGERALHDLGDRLRAKRITLRGNPP